MDTNQFLAPLIGSGLGGVMVAIIIFYLLPAHRTQLREEREKFEAKLKEINDAYREDFKEARREFIQEIKEQRESWQEAVAGISVKVESLDRTMANVCKGMKRHVEGD